MERITCQDGSGDTRARSHTEWYVEELEDPEHHEQSWQGQNGRPYTHCHLQHVERRKEAELSVARSNW